MELKLKFNDKERHILYRVLAVVLSLVVLATMTFTSAYFGRLFDWSARQQFICGMVVSPIFYLIINAVIKHYR
jgi:hypothetical protein